jgi:tetratricopeptide (TPR) repeat protein
MGWRLFEQDRALADTRLRERREQAADLAVTILRQRLSEAEQALANPSLSDNFAPGDVALAVVFEPGRIDAYPKDGLLYYPSLPPQPEAPESWFRRGEELEVQSRDYAKAIASFRDLLGNADAAVCAGARLRIARCLRSAGQLEAALGEYRELSRFEGVAFHGVPVSLVAARARCAVLAGLNRQDELKKEAGALYADLCRGRWRIDQAVYQVDAREIGDWIQVDRTGEQERLALAGGIDWLWEKWPSMAQGGISAAGRRSLEIEGRPTTLFWKSAPDRLTALVAGPRYLE